MVGKYRIVWPIGALPIGTVLSLSATQVEQTRVSVYFEIPHPQTGEMQSAGAAEVSLAQLLDSAIVQAMGAEDTRLVAPDMQAELEQLKKDAGEYRRMILDLQNQRNEALGIIEGLRAEMALKPKYMSNGEVMERAIEAAGTADTRTADGGPLPTAQHVQDEGSN